MPQKIMQPPDYKELPPLYGLVLSGGNSTRMRRSKSELNYHGKPQLVHAFDLLSSYCERVFVSTRKDQAAFYTQFPQIHDRYQNLGPLNGILSAMMSFPEAAWFVLANDLPYVDDKAIQVLIEQRSPGKIAVAYYNLQKHFSEPLCTIYEPAMKAHFLDFLHSEGYIFRKVLDKIDLHLVEPPHTFTLINVNNPEEYQQVVKHLAQYEKREHY